MRKLFYTLLFLLISTLAFGADWPLGTDTCAGGDCTFYDGLEDRPKDQQVDDEHTGPFHSAYIGNAPHADCQEFVKDGSISPRYGSQYLHLSCQWGAASATGCDGGFGRIGFERANIEFRGAELDTGLYIEADNGTEYWFGWSMFILADEEEQLLATNIWQLQSYSPTYSCGHHYTMTFGSYIESFKIRNTNSTGSETHFVGSWIDLKGTWVDFVVHARLYSTNNANARLRTYINGVLVDSAHGDGVNNMRASDANCPPYVHWQAYNSWHCGDIGTDTDCTTTQNGGYPDYCGCSNAYDDGSTNALCEGDWEDWQRDVPVDEIRVNEYTSGQGYNYCDVSPPIWGTKPSISFPADDQEELDTTFDALFDGYSDHKSEGDQNCYTAYQTRIQVNEQADGDFTTSLVVDATVSSTNEYEVTGLAINTTYVMRIEQSSYNTARSTEYRGVDGSNWSDTLTFTTADIPPDPQEFRFSIKGGGVTGGEMN